MSTKKPTLNELLEAVNGELETQKKQLEDKIHIPKKLMN